jgi:hypothetical protein
MSCPEPPSSLEDSPASPSAWLDSDEEPPTADGSGPSSHGSLAFYDPASRSWRTSQGSLLDLEWPRFLGTWPRSGTMRNGTVSPRPPSVPRISVTGSSLWPTPVGQDDGKTPEAHLAMKAERGLWPTPTASDASQVRMTASGRHGSLQETMMARRGLWPTPKTPTGGGQMARTTPGGGIRKLEDAVSQEIGRNTGALNPTWVEWLMGFPLGWTDCAASGTPSSPRSRNGSGGR